MRIIIIIEDIMERTTRWAVSRRTMIDGMAGSMPRAAARGKRLFTFRDDGADGVILTCAARRGTDRGRV
ncbi:hypothetical protein [Brachybacterium squillarum]|uniref:hypothetical protein n=1 Tax=Brachybacterium squillarum TaxID=661979 RepID=UPI000262989D|nr:hypothetical protein [Brachybacterium squillarum]